MVSLCTLISFDSHLGNVAILIVFVLFGLRIKTRVVSSFLIRKLLWHDNRYKKICFSSHDLVCSLIPSYTLCLAQKTMGVFHNIYRCHQVTFLTCPHPIDLSRCKPHHQAVLLPIKVPGIFFNDLSVIRNIAWQLSMSNFFW